MEPNCPLFCYSQQPVNGPLSLNKSSSYCHMLFPTELVNITLQSMSRPLSSLLVSLPKFCMFSQLSYLCCISHTAYPISFQMHSSFHYSNDKIFTVNKNVQVNSRSFWQWHIAIRVIYFLYFVQCIIFKRIHISETGSLPVLILEGEKEPTQLSLTEKAILCQWTKNNYLPQHIYLGLTFVIWRWIK